MDVNYSYYLWTEVLEEKRYNNLEDLLSKKTDLRSSILTPLFDGQSSKKQNKNYDVKDQYVTVMIMSNMKSKYRSS